MLVNIVKRLCKNLFCTYIGLENASQKKEKKNPTRTLIRTWAFVIKNIKSLYSDVEKIENDYEQSKLCLLISNKQFL